MLLALKLKAQLKKGVAGPHCGEYIDLGEVAHGDSETFHLEVETLMF